MRVRGNGRGPYVDSDDVDQPPESIVTSIGSADAVCVAWPWASSPGSSTTRMCIRRCPNNRADLHNRLATGPARAPQSATSHLAALTPPDPSS